MFLSKPQRCQVVFSGFLRFSSDFCSICTWMMGKTRILGVSTTKTDATLLTAMASRILQMRLSDVRYWEDKIQKSRKKPC